MTKISISSVIRKPLFRVQFVAPVHEGVVITPSENTDASID